MTSVSVEKLYEYYDVLQDAIAAKKIGDYAKEYEDIIETGSKGADKEKLLAVQFISAFFKYFPSLQFQAIEALFDSCEDDNMSIRKTAMKVLPNLCKCAKEHTLKVADILSQLLQLEDPQEHTIAMMALCEVIKTEPLLAMRGFFKQITSGEEIVHEKCIKFMAQKFPSLGPSVMTKEVEDFVFLEIKKVLEKNRKALRKLVLDTNRDTFKICSSDDFTSIMDYLSSTRFVSTPAGQLEYVQLCADYAELNEPIEPALLEVEKIIVCTGQALRYISSQIDSSKFLLYICDQILPHWEQIKSNEGEHAEKVCMRILQILAQISPYCGQLKNPIQQVTNIFEVLKTYMPLPPENAEVHTLPMSQFSYVESLIYAFHQLARQCPEFLTQNPALLKDFRIRLQYFSRGVQGCIKTLNEGKGLEDTKAKQTALKVTTNVNTLIKDLFYTPPNYKSIVKLSFLSPKKMEVAIANVKTEIKQSPTKRHAPITIDFDKGSTHNKQRKNSENVKIYTPPSGKFSNNFQNQARKPGRGRGRGFGKRGGSRGNWRK